MDNDFISINFFHSLFYYQLLTSYLVLSGVARFLMLRNYWQLTIYGVTGMVDFMI
ncbi:hypothetical protein CLERM_020 [Coxiella-like endosymbiont]|nr:hypothetical protein CLERM_020 [Coxiella-like endosymbiont]